MATMATMKEVDELWGETSDLDKVIGFLESLRENLREGAEQFLEKRIMGNATEDEFAALLAHQLSEQVVLAAVECAVNSIKEGRNIDEVGSAYFLSMIGILVAQEEQDV